MVGNTTESITPLEISTALVERPTAYIGSHAQDGDRMAARMDVPLTDGTKFTFALDDPPAMRRLAMELLEASESIREWDEVYGPNGARPA